VTETAEPTTHSRKRRAVQLLIMLLVGYAFWLVAGCAMQRKVLFPRDVTRPASNPGADMPGVEKKWQAYAGGRVEVWFAPAMGDAPRPAVILGHGNAELIDNQSILVDGYRRLGIHVLMVEYRGYGRSDGSPSQQAITKDHIAAYDQLKQDPRVDPAKIFFHGQSIGTGVVCSLAKERAPAALILRSPFRSVSSMMARVGIPSFLVLDPFDNEAVLKTLDVPILIMHGDRDQTIPIQHGRTLAKSANHVTFKVYADYGHNDFPIDGTTHWKDIEQFLSASGIRSAM
jgi:fermentation-respiration switch protein FrsA (DUF1100 family)